MVPSMHSSKTANTSMLIEVSGIQLAEPLGENKDETITANWHKNIFHHRDRKPF